MGRHKAEGQHSRQGNLRTKSWNRTGGRSLSVQLAELPGAEKDTVGTEAPTRVWRSLHINVRNVDRPGRK